MICSEITSVGYFRAFSHSFNSRVSSPLTSTHHGLCVNLESKQTPTGGKVLGGGSPVIAVWVRHWWLHPHDSVSSSWTTQASLNDKTDLTATCALFPHRLFCYIYQDVYTVLARCMPQMCEWCTKLGADQQNMAVIYPIFHSGTPKRTTVLNTTNKNKNNQKNKPNPQWYVAQRLRTSFYAKSRIIAAWKGSPRGLFIWLRVPLWQLGSFVRREKGEWGGAPRSVSVSGWFSLEQYGTFITLGYSIPFKVTSNVILSCTHIKTNTCT